LLNDISNLPRLDYLSVKYSYPKWLVKKWLSQFGNEEIEQVLISNNAQAPLEIRVNKLKTTRENMIQLLKTEGMNAEKCEISKSGVVIQNPSDIDKIHEYCDGLFSIQSESSMLVGEALNPKEGSFVIDMCAAPGGKSLSVAEIMNNTGKILSRDIFKGKIGLIQNEAKRLNLDNIWAEAYDALVLDEELVGKADYCIADVPCSGLGIIRRKPEIKYNKEAADLKSIVSIQYKILENASKYLKKNGELVYSTCTTNKEENIYLVKDFLKNNGDYELVDMSSTFCDFSTAKDGYIEIYPHLNHMDGFFIAKIKRL
jgi:16S rRNA (cytosine967-C5)-methyltransferase